MYQFTGMSVSPGVAVGPVERIDHGITGLHRIVCDPFRERALYDVAVVLAKDELRRLSQRAKGPDADILLFQIALLEDESFTNEIGDYIAAGAGGAAAVERAEQIFSGRLNNVDDDYIRERSVDVCDACRRVVDILDGRPRRRLHLSKPSILVADRFFPSDLFSLDRSMVLALASDQDSATSHAAIMARSFGIPAVVQLGDGVANLAVGHKAVVDAERGVLTIEPTPAHLAEALGRRAPRPNTPPVPDPVLALPSVTRGGTPFRLFTTADLAAERDVSKALAAGAEGIGLLRTEIALVNELDEQAQYEGCCALLEQAGTSPLLVRLYDTGADGDEQWSQELRTRLAGNRLEHLQLRALLRAAGHGQLAALIPSVTGIEDWDACMREVEACRAELQAQGQLPDRALPLACIVDRPATALMAGELLEHGAYALAIDLDDLARYTCGLPADAPSGSYRLDAPAVQRLVGCMVQAAQQANAKIYLTGLAAAQTDILPAYLRLGVRTFSVERSALPAAKKLLREQEI